MTSLGVASEATSSSATRKPTRSLVARTKLVEPGVVLIDLPITAKPGCFIEGEVKLNFLHFAEKIRFGMLNFFVHAPDPIKFHGVDNLTARAEVWEKSYTDGSKFLHIDLYPVEDQEPTHFIVVVPKCQQYWGPKDFPYAPLECVLYETPRPLQGVIAFVPLAAPSTHAAPPKQPAATASATGDVQLDRLLSAGWVIDNETAAEVYLTKNGKKMTHHKPKQKDKKKKR
jgi:hypothetical protein